MIELYVYEKATGEYLYTDTGIPEMVFEDLDGANGFTLETPPTFSNHCYWRNKEWVVGEPYYQPEEESIALSE